MAGPALWALIAGSGVTSAQATPYFRFDNDYRVDYESGSQTHSVRLSARPTGNVTVTVSSSDTGVVTIDSGYTSLTFTTGNWNSNQDVNTSSANSVSGTESATVNFSASGGGYDGVTGSIWMNIYDDADSTDPSVSSAVRHSPSTETTDADSVTWRITFDEPVESVDASDFSVSGTTATLSVSPATSVDRSRATWDVTASGGDLANLQATITLSAAAAQNIQDLNVDATPNRNTWDGTFPAGAQLSYNITPVITLSPPSVSMGATFSASGQGFGDTESVSLHLARTRTPAPADCGAVVNFSHTLGTATASGGAVTISGISVDSRFVQGSENYLCLVGNVSNATSPVVQLHVGAPTVGESVEFTSTPESGGDTYEHGEYVEVTLTFGEAVTIDSGESIRLQLAGTTYSHAYAVGGGAASVTQAFRYTVAAGDYAPRGIAVVGSGRKVHGRTVPGVTVRNTGGVAYTVDYPSLDRDPNHRVDARSNVSASVQIVSSPERLGEYGYGEEVRFRVDAPKGVRGSAPSYNTLPVAVGNDTVRAALVSQTDTSWTFGFTVGFNHKDRDGVGVRQSVIRLVREDGREWGLRVPRLGSQQGHRIDGGRIDDICKVFPKLPQCERPPDPPTPPDPPKPRLDRPPDPPKPPAGQPVYPPSDDPPASIDPVDPPSDDPPGDDPVKPIDPPIDAPSDKPANPPADDPGDEPPPPPADDPGVRPPPDPPAPPKDKPPEDKPDNKPGDPPPEGPGIYPVNPPDPGRK